MKNSIHAIRGRIKYIVVAIIIAAVVLYIYTLTVDKTDYQNLTLQELSENGFYVYLFEHNYEDQNAWNRRIHMISFNFLCSASDNIWNPVSVSYDSELVGTMQIDLFYTDSPYFDDQKDTNTISLNAAWIPENSGEYYVSENGEIKMRIIDKFGNEVTITSNIELQHLAALVSKLEFQGKGQSIGSNPWLDIC